MKIEIGSNFWEYSISGYRKEKFWWESDKYSKLYFKSGRNAFKAICESLKLHEKKVLFPAYHCETESNPWYENNWAVAYYTVDENFRVDAQKLDDAIRMFSPTVLVIQSYFGFESYDKKCESVLHKYKMSGGIIIEDITQTLLSDIKHEISDFYVCSFRKFFAIPDGGVLISRKAISIDDIFIADLNISVTALEAYSLKHEYFDTKNIETKNQFREKYVELNELLSVDDKLYEMSTLSKKILKSIDVKYIRERRRENYIYLYNELRGVEYIETPCILSNENDVPLFLPSLIIDYETRMLLRSYLASKDIYCPIIWQKPNRILDQSSETENIYSRILCFPIDQRYDKADMDRIVDALMEWKKNS